MNGSTARSPWVRLAHALACAGVMLAARSAAAQDAPALPPGGDDEVDADNDTAGYAPADPTPPSALGQSLQLAGYVDVGFAKAQGDGTSFAAGDARVPADYGVDAFAPAVNARGDVASTNAGDRFVNGFLPRSVGIAGRPSFLLNTVDLDARFQSAPAPLMVFTRVQLLPRLSAAGDASRLFVEQAFGRVMPFDARSCSLSVGKFDSVFGIEYLDNQANFRTGVTPSLSRATRRASRWAPSRSSASSWARCGRRCR